MLLLPLLVVMTLLVRDRSLMGEDASGTAHTFLAVAMAALVAACAAALAVLALR